MTEENQKNRAGDHGHPDTPSPFKIVSLIASIMGILGIFIGAVTWISINMSNHAVLLKTLKEGHLRQEEQIMKNAEVIRRIDQHESSLQILTEFMTKGGRFTEADGRILQEKVDDVQARLQHYEVLETELGWIKRTITKLEYDISKNFDKVSEQLEEIPKKDHTHN